jgi:tripartite ATP-independent transporter DctM subunit
MMLGALIGPMSGSVGASVLAMTRIVAPRLSASGIPAPTRFAVVAVASTLGVVIPPSLVLILLGDAMLSAHTMAVTASGRADRVINTQDVFHGALVPAAIMLVFCLLVAWRAGRNIQIESSSQQKTTLTGAQAILAGISVLSLVTLLGGIAAGQFYAVEAAAMGATVLLVTGIVFGHLRLKALDEILRDTMAVTGALFALLLAATTLTLVLRTFGTDRLIGNWITSIPGNDIVVMTVVLAAIGICAFVLDAFEIIFVVIPIVVPPLLVRVADARWVAVLILLTLQISFLLPPLGYALMMVRGNFKENISFSALARAFSPFLLAQWVVLAIVLCAPQLVHIGEKAADTSRTPLVPLSDQEINRRFEQMMPKLPEPD